MNKVDFDTATQEVEKWLDAKKIPQRKRDQMKAMTDNMVDAMQEGLLRMDDDCTLIQTLQFPESDQFSELKFKLRITSFDLEQPKKIVKGDGLDDNLTRILMALTNAPVNVIRKLDSSVDRPIADSIATFFL